MYDKNRPVYYAGQNGEFVIENYNQAKPFSSFFPGIAGADGTPMWVFYVNRGQCICSMGIEDKQKPIMEFLSANRAYQLTSTQGFRTFIKIVSDTKDIYYEPFQDQLLSIENNCVRRMIINPESLIIEEDNESLGLCFKVEYLNIVRQNFAGLIRVLTIENKTKKEVRLEVLDGLPMIVPFGVDNFNLKNMRRLVESFVEVVNLDKKAPYFKVRVKQQDSPEVVPVREGNFYTGFISEGSKKKLVKLIVDTEKIFGNLADFMYPKAFINNTPFTIKGKQATENRLPCAMGNFSLSIAAGRSCSYNSIIGSISSVEKLNSLLSGICTTDYISKMRSENRALIENLTQSNFINSECKLFDLYCRQNFLDNVLRGGFPVTFKSGSKNTVIHLYSRKHGDLERDYNDYRLAPTNYSQGNGNYRDVEQNRRNELLFNPDVHSSNIEEFYNLIQLDGFNPLIVKPNRFKIKNGKKLRDILQEIIKTEDLGDVLKFFKELYTPGEFVSYIYDNNIKTKKDIHSVIAEILAISETIQESDYGHGFWSEHWTYNLDLVENYLAVYPEKLRYILLGNRNFTFFDNPHYVRPREEKYVLWDGKPMQIDAVGFDEKKECLIKTRTELPNLVRSEYGKGEIYRTTLAHKILSIIVNKVSSLDFEGVGIEMESDKPDWYDALNGLPGLFGSSINETFELKRLANFMLNSFRELQLTKNDSVKLACETLEFIEKMTRLLKTNRDSKSKKRDFEYWQEASDCRENYRLKTHFGIEGKQVDVPVRKILKFLESVCIKTEHGIAKAMAKSKDGVLPTYFANEVKSYDKIKDKKTGKVKLNHRGFECIRVKKSAQRALPLFLEGPVHCLRAEKDYSKAKLLARSVRKSGLFDKNLKMYKVNESLANEPYEIGRTRTFSRGWLENESIWMHMEYKYMLELLRCGLYEEFYKDFKTVFVPFMDPSVYGRSILENSSFIASSANPDSNIHGTGFVARLSGSTAEFVHILLSMTVGEKPFRINEDNKLTLSFNPVIPEWLFTQKDEEKTLWVNNKKVKRKFAANTFSFMFLGSILVTYKNPLRGNTFGPDAVKPALFKIEDENGKITKIQGSIVDDEMALKVRMRKIKTIEIELG
jgi:hypothetical protein